MSKYKFQFNPAADTTLSITCDSITYELHMIWLDVSEVWTVSIYQKSLPVTEGRVVNINQDLFINVPNTGKLAFEGEVPTRNNIGRSCFLYYYEKEDDL